ncbi:hypothetical protein [Acinetobacter wuhouensis]|uniref:Lipoprotein n=1 Tax=Acinetobacter wuhouensis TaxID=1879050 RepID=A0A4Q7AJD1_9GAMM|nr:hypothetical protein [Acinetobacter wuhouensis]RZG45781.1 hypothetical protein EXU28_11230 [Acinetobacter wuhouensis]
MHLKKITLCLMGLSLSACSSHVIKNNNLNDNKSTSQRAIQGFNALYEYPSFDYRGQVKVQFVSEQKENKASKNEVKKLDKVVEQKVNQYLKEQKIMITEAQRKDLYHAIASQNNPSFRDFFGKGADYMQSILNDLQIQYDGSVNYRQKIASFNLDTKYKKPNLSVEMRIPTIIDLNNQRFYTHIFSLMPYLANPQDQDKYAYLDFSKYKDDIERVNAKALLEFLKQSGATTYLLASPDQLETMSLNTVEKQSGIVEKIRLKTSLEELFLQGNLYTSVNRQYFMTSVLGFNSSNLAKNVDEAEDSKSKSTSAATEHTEIDATSAMYQLYEAINRTAHSELKEEGDDDLVTQNQTDNERETVDEETEATDDSENTTQLLTEQQCEDLAKAKSNVRFGDVEYCQAQHEIDVLSDSADQGELLVENTQQKQNRTALTQKFTALAQDQLVDAAQFKQLWDQHQSEIDASLPPKNQRNPMIVDLSLDAQGRVVKADYDMGMDFGKYDRQLKIKMDMQISNYGKATAIDQQVLKEAKPFKEVFKGSFMEKAVGGFAGDLSTSDKNSDQKNLSLDEHLQQLAAQVYMQTNSYEKAYKAVFIAKLTAEKPVLIKQYSAKDLQEIAAIYAYSYSDEEAYNPSGQALKQIEALKTKHHLEEDEQYDDELGNAIDGIITQAMTSQKSTAEILNLAKKYKTAEAVFAQYYMQQFELENTVEKDQRTKLNKTAQILAKSYTAFKNNQFNNTVVAGLDENAAEFIDYDLYKKTYQVVSDAKLK